MTRPSVSELIQKSGNILLNTYAAQPVILDRGRGCHVWDTENKKYLDFAAGIAVASLGHAHPAVLEALRAQAEKIIACPPSFLTMPKLECAELLAGNSCFDRVFFCNSGTEAIEAAIKTVRKWAYDGKGADCHEIISFRKSFHGRTYGAASLTEKRHGQPFFGPYMPGVLFAEFNDIDSVRALVSDKTCAIFVEPVQGEGGIIPAQPAFLQGLRRICDERGIALVFDEIQTGMGRLGTLFAYEAFGVEPDVAALAKGLGSGFPIGAMLAKEKFSAAITVGTHGTTYGGNPLATAVASAVLKELLRPGFLAQVRDNGAYFLKKLGQLKLKSAKITEVRGMGLLAGVDIAVDIKKFLRSAQGRGLLATQAGDSTVRLTPPLIVTKAEIDEAVDLMEATLNEI
jgi:predicted acetylornithine/succinylornithine family transaminase